MDNQSSFPCRASITVYIDGTFVQGRLEGSGIRGSRIWGDDDFPEDPALPSAGPAMPRRYITGVSQKPMLTPAQR